MDDRQRALLKNMQVRYLQDSEAIQFHPDAPPLVNDVTYLLLTMIAQQQDEIDRLTRLSAHIQEVT